MVQRGGPEKVGIRGSKEGGGKGQRLIQGGGGGAQGKLPP